MNIMNPAMIWLILLIVLLIIEILTMGLTTIWFAGGALAAFLSTFFGAGTGTQIAIFLSLSMTLLILTRPAALRFFNRGSHERTNADSLVGRTALVTKEINNLAQSGELVISDVSWTARSREDGCVIPAGRKVRICSIEGVKLIVEEADKIKEEK